MALEITGSLIKKLSVQSGNSARGEWQKQEFIVETHENFPRKVCFNVWGADKVSDLASYREGENIKVSFNVESREFKERWYTELRAWRIERIGTEADLASNRYEEYPMPENLSDSGEDDLPF
jgi:Protein of unknown function (DUF3127).